MKPMACLKTPQAKEKDRYAKMQVQCKAGISIGGLWCFRRKEVVKDWNFMKRLREMERAEKSALIWERKGDVM